MKNGSLKATLALAWIFEEGIGYAQDMDEAKWLYMQAENEDPHAAFSLGKIYEEGNDPEGDGTPDFKKAIKYYEKAISMGSKDAEVWLA